jgi:hypothetical protein
LILNICAVGRYKNIISFIICNSKDSFDDEVIPNVLKSMEDVYYYAGRAYLVESLEGDLFQVRKFLSLWRMFIIIVIEHNKI